MFILKCLPFSESGARLLVTAVLFVFLGEIRGHSGTLLAQLQWCLIRENDLKHKGFHVSFTVRS